MKIRKKTRLLSPSVSFKSGIWIIFISAEADEVKGEKTEALSYVLFISLTCSLHPNVCTINFHALTRERDGEREKEIEHEI